MTGSHPLCVCVGQDPTPVVCVWEESTVSGRFLFSGRLPVGTGHNTSFHQFSISTVRAHALSVRPVVAPAGEDRGLTGCSPFC